MAYYEFNAYDTRRDDWDTLESRKEVAEAIADNGLEVWLYRWTDADGLTDKAEVKDGRLPDRMDWEGYKVPKRYHAWLETLSIDAK